MDPKNKKMHVTKKVLKGFDEPILSEDTPAENLWDDCFYEGESLDDDW